MASVVKMRSKNVTPINFTQVVLFIENEFCLDREGALDHDGCARSHVIAPISHSAVMKAMAARATHVSRVHVDAVDREVHSIVSLCARSHKQGLIASFPPFTAL